ncbi:MAG: SNF2-related protein [Nanopusillaceae archaeon]
MDRNAVIKQNENLPKLLSYQLEALDFLRSNKYRGYILLPPGAGKTLITCYAIKEYIQFNKERNRELNVIIFAPKSAIPSWEREIRKLGLENENIQVLNYERLLKVSEEELKKLYQAHFLVLDEAHRIKNIKAKTTRLLMKFGYKKIPKILLSATPFKEAIDLYTQFFVLDPGILGKWNDFIAKYFIKESNPFGGITYILKDGMWDEILNQVKPYVFKRDKDEIDILKKDKKFYILKVPTHPEYSWERFKKEVLQEVSQNFEKEIDDITFSKFLEEIKGKFITFFRKAQVSNEEKHKKIALFVKARPNTVIYTPFVEEARIIAKMIDGYLITGETSQRERKEILSKQDKPLVITDALSEGVDLNRYQNMILAVVPSSIIRFKQIVGRIDRLSQESSNLNYIFVLDEYGERMFHLLKERKKLDTALKQIIKKEIKKMSTERQNK